MDRFLRNYQYVAIYLRLKKAPLVQFIFGLLFYFFGMQLVWGANEDLNLELQSAARTGQVERLQYLLSRGANPDTTNAQGRTPLMGATFMRNLEIMRILIAAGANIDARDRQKDTPLLIAVARGDIRVVRLLIDAGANLNIQNGRGESSLTIAKKAGYSEIADLLSDFGAAEAEPQKTPEEQKPPEAEQQIPPAK